MAVSTQIKAKWTLENSLLNAFTVNEFKNSHGNEAEYNFSLFAKLVG